tara:strand:- start:149 stop:250 length:102 start_codon:yes stop_codon:yes gene_type:complete
MILKIIGFFALVYLAAEYMPLILETTDKCLGNA